MLPIALSMEGWADIYSIFILSFLILGVFEIIIGLYLSIKENINEHLIGYIGFVHFLIGCAQLYFYYYALALIIPGIILIILGFKNQFCQDDKWNTDLH
ncbi:MAG: hypothetical protein ACFFHD_13565 [Promethearchaeota archaeon]